MNTKEMVKLGCSVLCAFLRFPGPLSENLWVPLLSRGSPFISHRCDAGIIVDAASLQRESHDAGRLPERASLEEWIPTRVKNEMSLSPPFLRLGTQRSDAQRVLGKLPTMGLPTPITYPGYGDPGLNCAKFH